LADESGPGTDRRRAVLRGELIRRGVALFLPSAAALTIAAVVAFGAVQQDLRIGANDVPQQLAEDAVRYLEAGESPATVVGSKSVTIETSLVPFLAIYDASGTELASSGTVDGRPPSVPAGVLDSARATGRDAVTWQPRSGIRVAIVVMPWPGGTVVAGRSLRVIESRIEAIQLLVFEGLVAGLLIVAAAAAVAARVWPERTAIDR
jgi:hypothetical protein